MITLGFDTATPASAVGLRLSDGSTLQARDDPGAGERPGHATRLLPMAAGLLAEAGVSWGEVERIAVGVGPGTFTGLRIGVATARGLAQSLGNELVGVSSLRALAFGAAHEAREVLAVIDARRGEVFVAGYGEGRELLAPCVLAPEGLSEALEQVGGRDDRCWLAVGDGAVRYAHHLLELGVRVAEDDSSLHKIAGAAICELGVQAHAGDVRGVVPDYLRRPDAELALEGAPR